MKKPYAIRLMIVLALAMLTNAAAYAQAAPTRPKPTTTQNKPAAPKPQPVHSNNTPVQKPTVTTYNVSGVKSDMARCGGSVNSSGGSSVTAYGVCWSTSPHPTRNDYKTVDGSGVDEFNSTMTNLQAGTTYYVRAYATNSEGTAYGKEVTFTTEENHEDQLCPVTLTVKDYDGKDYVKEKTKKNDASKKTKTTTVQEVEYPVRFLEEKPEFPGGNEAIAAFLAKEIKYPEAALKNGVQGTVLVEFVVEKDGKVSNPKVIVSLSSDCDKEAVRAVMAMPKWKSGKSEGKPTRCYYQIPISFQL